MSAQYFVPRLLISIVSTGADEAYQEGDICNLANQSSFLYCFLSLQVARADKTMEERIQIAKEQDIINHAKQKIFHFIVRCVSAKIYCFFL